MQNVFVWVDIPVTDLNRAVAFYSAVLGETVTLEGGSGFPYGLLPHAENNISGCLYESDSNAPSANGPLVYLNAAGRLNEAVAAVETNGGAILEPVHQIGPHGYRALVRDSEGNTVALHSPRL